MASLGRDVMLEAQLGRKYAGAQVLALGDGAAHRSTVLAVGIYRIACTDGCWILQGGASVTAVAATAPAQYMPPGSDDLLVESAAEGYVSAIQYSGLGGYLTIAPHR